MEAYEHFGGTIGDTGLIKAIENPLDTDHPGDVPRIDLDKAKEDHQVAIDTLTIIKEFLKIKEAYEAKIRAIARAETLAMMYLQRVDRKRYGDLWADLHNLYSRDDNQYPRDLGQAYLIVSNHVRERKAPKGNSRDNTAEDRTGPEMGVAFLQHEDLVPDSQGRTFPGIECWKCGNLGHYASSCATPTDKKVDRTTNAPKQQAQSEGQQMLQVKEATDTEEDKPTEHGVMFIQHMQMYEDLPSPLLEAWEESDSSDDEYSIDEDVVNNDSTMDREEDEEHDDDIDTKSTGTTKPRYEIYIDDMVAMKLDASDEKHDSNRPRKQESSTVTTSAHEASFMQGDARGKKVEIPKEWVLLDSQSTVSVFNNAKYLTNIRNADRELKVILNGGTQVSNQIGDIQNFGTVWYNPRSLANILSLAEVRKNNRVTMDTAEEAAMIVHRQDGSEMKFIEFKTGLYYYDGKVPETDNSGNNNDTISSYSFVQTVANNKKLYHKREIEGANKARELYIRLGRPSQHQFQKMLANNMIPDCPITADDARRAIRIYGPDVATLKGKTTKTKGNRHPTFEPVELPAYITERHKKITISQDIFYVQGIPFFHTISKKVQFRTAAVLPNRKKETLLKETKSVINLYQHRGFQVMDIHADKEFECLKEDLRPININIVGADEHVHDIEHSIRTVKDRVRSTVHGLPYKRYPRIMMIKLVGNTMCNINQLPALNGISEHMSPLSIVTGQKMVSYAKLRVSFGSYVQVHESMDRTNTTEPRTIGAIALGMSSSRSGHYEFMNLNTGKILSRKHFTVLPVTDAVIKRVEHIAKEDKQAPIVGSCPMFEWNLNQEIAFEDDDNKETASVTSNNSIIKDSSITEDMENEDIVLGTDDMNIEEQVANEAPEDENEVNGENPIVERHQEDNDIDKMHVIDQALEEMNMNAAERAPAMVEDDELPYITDNDESTEEQKVASYDEDVAPDNYESTDDEEDDKDSDEEDEPPPLKPRPLDDDSNAGNDDNVDIQKHGKTRIESPKRDTSSNTDKKDSQNTNGAEKRSEQPEPETRRRYNLRSNRKSNYAMQFLQLATDSSYNLHMKDEQRRQQVREKKTKETTSTVTESELLRTAVDNANEGATGKLFKYVTEYMFTQMTADAGIKKHGQVAVDALIKEFAQLHDKKVFEGLHPEKLTVTEKRDSLPSINLIKEKRDGKIKGRSVADGRKQHKMFLKDEITSPTVSTDALLMTLIVDAMEEREVGTADVPGAYLQADMEDHVILKMTGRSVDALCETDESYRALVRTEKGMKVIYLRLKKALYGCIKSAMLWYNLFTENLKEMGFEINPYDTSVANKMINGKQCTIVWYVDDLKVSHVDKKVVLEVLESIKN